MDDHKLFAVLTPAVITAPALRRVETDHPPAAHTLKSALAKVESAYPGFQYDLMNAILAQANLDVNMCEALLRLQTDASLPDLQIYRPEPAFQELRQRAVQLKRTLGKIPEEIHGRKVFLDTIKDIASAIKHLLDAVNTVMPHIPSQHHKQTLEQKKREFVKYSKRFSNTLKDFFRENQEIEVFLSANYLVHQTNVILKTVQSIT